MQSWFLAANKMFRWSHQIEQLAAINATAGTPFLPRDWPLMAYAGTAWLIEHPSGKRTYPLQSIMKVSESLDVLSAEPGKTLVRGPERWEARDPAGGGGGWAGMRSGFSAAFSAADWTPLPLFEPAINTAGFIVTPETGRIEIPPGVSMVRASIVAMRTAGTSDRNQWRTYLNDVRIEPIEGGMAGEFKVAGYTNTASSFSSSIFAVAPGDLLDIRVFVGASLSYDGSLTVEALG